MQTATILPSGFEARGEHPCDPSTPARAPVDGLLGGPRIVAKLLPSVAPLAIGAAASIGVKDSALPFDRA